MVTGEMEQIKFSLTVDEAALVLGVGRSCLYEAIRRNELPVIRLGRRILIPRKVLADLLGEESDSISIFPLEVQRDLK
jgi:excisionase family DNA binding protein